MAYVEVYVNEDTILENLDDSELLAELKKRKLEFETKDGIEHLITSIWLKRRVGVDYQKELDELIYKSIGKIV